MSNRTLPQTTKDLIAGKKLIENEKDWCIGALINDKGQMCAIGALSLASTGQAFTMETRECFGVLQEAAHCEFHTVVSSVNNELGHTAVMEMFDRAIADSLRDGKGSGCV